MQGVARGPKPCLRCGEWPRQVFITGFKTGPSVTGNRLHVEGQLADSFDRSRGYAVEQRPVPAARGILWEILRHYQCNDGLGLWRALQQLQALKWKGDDRDAIRDFYYKAIELAEEALAEGYPAGPIYTALKLALKQSKVLAHRLVAYEYSPHITKDWQSLLMVVEWHMKEVHFEDMNTRLTRDPNKRPAGGAPEPSAKRMPKAPPPQPTGGSASSGLGGRPGAKAQAPTPGAFDWEETLKRWPNKCRNQMMWQNCKWGANCRRCHIPLEGADKRDYMEAMEKRKRWLDSRPAREDSPARSWSAAQSGGTADIGECFSFKKQGHCKSGDACIYRHGDSQKEWTQAKTARQGSGRARPSAGVESSPDLWADWQARHNADAEIEIREWAEGVRDAD